MTPPSDLTTLAKRHSGKLPEECVAKIVRLGQTHPRSRLIDMPVWGPIFSTRDKFSEPAGRQRIKNLCNYVATLQEEES